MGDVELRCPRPKALGPSYKLAGSDRGSVGKSDRIAGNEHKYFGYVTEAVVAEGEPVQKSCMEYGLRRPSTGRCLAIDQAAGHVYRGLLERRCEPLQNSRACSESFAEAHRQNGATRDRNLLRNCD